MSGARAEAVPEEEPGGQSEPQPDPQRAEVEERARSMGWVPRERWTSTKTWVDAPEFVRYAEQRLPVQNAQLRALEERNRVLESEREQDRAAIAQAVASIRRSEQIGYKRAMQELRQRREEAVIRGDATAFRATEQEMQELGAPPPDPVAAAPQAPAQPATPPPDPIVIGWVQRNPWFQSDPYANVAAVKALDIVRREFPNDSLDEQLNEVERRVRRKFNNDFEGQPRPEPAPRGNGDGREVRVTEHDAGNTRRQAPPMVHGSSASPSPRRPNPRSFEAMPQNVKDQFERQKRMMAGKGEPLTKEEWARYYYEQFEEEPQSWMREGAA